MSQVLSRYTDWAKAGLEALHALFSRPNFTDDEFVSLVVPMYDTKIVELCKQLFEWSTVDARDVDDDKYQFAKKFSEVKHVSPVLKMLTLTRKDDIVSRQLYGPQVFRLTSGGERPAIFRVAPAFGSEPESCRVHPRSCFLDEIIPQSHHQLVNREQSTPWAAPATLQF
jgi:hypothetical protein